LLLVVGLAAAPCFAPGGSVSPGPPASREASAAPVPAPDHDPASPEALGWTPAQHATARAYARGRWILWFVETLGGLVVLAVVAASGLAGRTEARLAPRLRAGWRRDAVVAAAVLAVLLLVRFPLDAVRRAREVSYGFATQGTGAWLWDWTKMAAVEVVLALAVLVPVYALMRRRPRAWWAAAAAVTVALGIFSAAIMPVFIAPLFNTFRPLPDGPLRERIVSMAGEHGIPGAEIYEVDASRQSRHDNAYVAGLLGTQRIVLYDTLLAAYTEDEVAFVLGHEMGHYLLAHIWKGLAAAAVGIVAGFWLLQRLLPWMVRVAGPRARITSPLSVTALPLLILFFSAYGTLLHPLGSAISRSMEHESDVFALRAIQHQPGWRDVAVSSFQKMAARNLSDPDPPAWIEWMLYSHPSVGRRIRFCATWQPDGTSPANPSPGA
jgi:STE24 endopeptidase